jgi:hypothetical protein
LNFRLPFQTCPEERKFIQSRLKSLKNLMEKSVNGVFSLAKSKKDAKLKKGASLT